MAQAVIGREPMTASSIRTVSNGDLLGGGQQSHGQPAVIGCFAP